MVPFLDHMERGQAAQFSSDVADQVEVGQIVPGALEEEHGNSDQGEMLSPGDAGPVGGVKREAEEHQTPDTGQGGVGLGGRGHPPAERFSTGQKRELRHFRPGGFGIQKGIDRPAAQPLLQLPRARAFLRWSRFPFLQADPSGAVWINDYRYANVGPYGWSAVKLQ